MVIDWKKTALLLGGTAIAIVLLAWVLGWPLWARRANEATANKVATTITKGVSVEKADATKTEAKGNATIQSHEAATAQHVAHVVASPDPDRAFVVELCGYQFYAADPRCGQGRSK